MDGSDVKLLGSWQSPYVLRVQMALKLKSVEYELVVVDPHNKNDPLLKKTNPVHKKIPVLIHGGRPMCESLVIIQYIDDVWRHAPSILPCDPYDRSQARFWAAYVDDKLLPLMKELKQEEENDARKEIIKRMSQNLAVLEDAFVRCSKGKGFFGGDNVGYVDIVLGCYLGWMRAIEILLDVKYFDETSSPELAAWAERLCSDSIVKDVIPSPQKLIDFHVSQAQAKASSE